MPHLIWRLSATDEVNTFPPFIRRHCFDLVQQVGEQKEGRKEVQMQQGSLRQQRRGGGGDDDGGDEGKDNASGILKQHGDDIMLIETGRAGQRRAYRSERFGERGTRLCVTSNPCLPQVPFCH